MSISCKKNCRLSDTKKQHQQQHTNATENNTYGKKFFPGGNTPDLVVVVVVGVVWYTIGWGEGGTEERVEHTERGIQYRKKGGRGERMVDIEREREKNVAERKE